MVLIPNDANKVEYVSKRVSITIEDNTFSTTNKTSKDLGLLLSGYEFVKNKQGNYSLSFTTIKNCTASITSVGSGNDLTDDIIITVNTDESGTNEFYFDLNRTVGFYFGFNQNDTTSKNIVTKKIKIPSGILEP
ncbi:MAG: hypothetical protein ACPGU9_02370 [Flavobacteriaceae bacterium]